MSKPIYTVSIVQGPDCYWEGESIRQVKRITN